MWIQKENFEDLEQNRNAVDEDYGWEEAEQPCHKHSKYSLQNSKSKVKGKFCRFWKSQFKNNSPWKF